MGLAYFEKVGPNGEALAEEAAKATDSAVGFDPDSQDVTFDSDALDDGQLQAAIEEALAGIDPDWGSHLRASG